MLPGSVSPVSSLLCTLYPRTRSEDGTCWRNPRICTCSITFVVDGVESFSRKRQLCHRHQHCDRSGARLSCTRLPCQLPAAGMEIIYEHACAPTLLAPPHKSVVDNGYGKLFSQRISSACLGHYPSGGEGHIHLTGEKGLAGEDGNDDGDCKRAPTASCQDWGCASVGACGNLCCQSMSEAQEDPGFKMKDFSRL